MGALIMRFSPLIPNEPLNYACAMTSMSLKHMAISTLGSLPKTAYEVWLAAQAASSFSSSGHGSGVSLPLIIIFNFLMLLLMVALCVKAKRKYDHYVDTHEAIPDAIRPAMKRRPTCRGFEADLNRNSLRVHRTVLHAAATFKRAGASAENVDADRPVYSTLPGA